MALRRYYRCKYEFCYICGAQWKTCKCVQADEAFIRGQLPGGATAAASPIPAQQFPLSVRNQLHGEILRDAELYEGTLKAKLAELKVLRRNREVQRDVLMVDRMVKHEEMKVKQELKEEEDRLLREKRKLARREQELKILFRKKLETVCAIQQGRKGKGREVNSRGELDKVVGILVEQTMVGGFWILILAVFLYIVFPWELAETFWT